MTRRCTISSKAWLRRKSKSRRRGFTTPSTMRLPAIGASPPARPHRHRASACMTTASPPGCSMAAAQAVVEKQPIGLIAYDLPYPGPLNAVRTIGSTFAVGMVIVPEPSRPRDGERDAVYRIAKRCTDRDDDPNRSKPSAAAIRQRGACRSSTRSRAAAIAGRARLSRRPFRDTGGRAVSGNRGVMIERVEIATLIPHAGTMCLLDRVIAWDERAIACRSGAAIATPDNPLRAERPPRRACGIEYAAQAMAVHGAAGRRGRRAAACRFPGQPARCTLPLPIGSTSSTAICDDQRGTADRRRAQR